MTLKRRSLLRAAALGAGLANLPGLSRAVPAPMPAAELPSPVLVNAAGAPRLTIGLSLPMQGVQAEVARDLKLGYELAIKHAQRDGLSIGLALENDNSRPDTTAENIKRFAADRTIVATSGIVGTPHALAALPVALEGGLPVVGLRSGAEELRTAPRPGLYHLRAGFNDEVGRSVKYLASWGVKNLSIVYSDDAFGNASVAWARKVAAEVKLNVVAAARADRDGGNIAQATDQAVKAPGADGLLLLVIAKPMREALERARTVHDFYGPVFCMSFCATREIALMNKRWIGGLAMFSAFPIARQMVGVPLASAFYQSASSSADPEAAHSLAAFEGFFYGTTIARAAARVKGPVSRESLVDALSRTPPAIDLGGIPVVFDRQQVGYNKLQMVSKSGSKLLFTA